ncbi:MAG TPA: DUF4254 domain-containing protein [Pirellulaceae bacterium]|nr:DUF4254 domain-containing protein [Pirellulaceae bacterium]
MLDISQVAAWQVEWVAMWHEEPFANRFEDWKGLVCEQHHWNFLLWHEEDIARSPTATDSEIAQVKRRIDRYNQARNDWIEKLDDYVSGLLIQFGVQPREPVQINTETLGSTIDRLSILALRIFHLEEQLQRSDVSPDHRRRVTEKLTVSREQHAWLSRAAASLAMGLFSGEILHRTFRQNKLYNDPSLNPQIYDAPIDRNLRVA